MRNILISIALVLAGRASTSTPMQTNAVARMWHGRTTDAKAAGHYDYLMSVRR